MENKIEAKNLDLYYGEKHALKNVSLDIKTNKITHTLFLHILLLFIKTIVHNRNLVGEVTKHSWDTYGRPA